MAIEYIDRKTGNILEEKVEGAKWIKFLYGSPIVGNSLLNITVKERLTHWFGKAQDHRVSAVKIKRFVKKHNIDLTESEQDRFKTFNDFFTRKLKPCARVIDLTKCHLISPADGRIMAYDSIDINRLIQIKGITYRLEDLLDNLSLAEKYRDGVCMVIRLCPVDYHRYHFPFDCKIVSDVEIQGKYYSVNPMALEKINELYVQNKRRYQVLENDIFGDVLMMSVGATFVGSIIENYKVGDLGFRGHEKGYFKFGGSTIIMFFEKDKIIVDQDLLSNSKQGYETKIEMGEKIGSTCT